MIWCDEHPGTMLSERDTTKLLLGQIRRRGVPGIAGRKMNGGLCKGIDLRRTRACASLSSCVQGKLAQAVQVQRFLQAHLVAVTLSASLHTLRRCC